jgi:FlaA1/EpsC-like NDP-sugar epimerase
MQASSELSNPRLSYEDGFAPTVDGLETPARKIQLSSYKIADIAIAVVSLLGAFLLTNLGAVAQHGASFLELRVSTNNLLLIVFFALAWSTTFQAFGLYRHQNRRLNLETIVRVLAASAAGASFAILFVITSRAGAFGHGTTLVFWLLAVCLAVAVRVILNLLIVPANRRPTGDFLCQ